MYRSCIMGYHLKLDLYIITVHSLIRFLAAHPLLPFPSLIFLFLLSLPPSPSLSLPLPPSLPPCLPPSPFFPLPLPLQGTEYENHVDVGQCSSEGVCENKSCEAVSLHLKTIPTPDGQSPHKLAIHEGHCTLICGKQVLFD